MALLSASRTITQAARARLTGHISTPAATRFSCSICLARSAQSRQVPLDQHAASKAVYDTRVYMQTCGAGPSRYRHISIATGSRLDAPRRRYSTAGVASKKSEEAMTAEGVEAMLPTLDNLGIKAGDRAVSGGVDSSVTLAILTRMPLDLDVVFMRNWDPLLSENQSDPPACPTTSSSLKSTLADLAYPFSPPSHRGGQSTCAWEKDWTDVQLVCSHLGIPSDKVRLMDLSKEYWSRVFEPSVAVWEAGGTPNPDVMCNREIKFGALLDAVVGLGGQGGRQRHFLATGHYARVVRSPPSIEGDEAMEHRGQGAQEGAALMRAIDGTKDQSYYLSAVTARQLQKMVTPLGSIAKSDVRRLARYFGLPTAERAESMGVCFIGERGRFGDFVSQYTHPTVEHGELVLPDGTSLGKHSGLWQYTIGQRARVAGQGQALFVAKKGVGAKGLDVLVVPGSDHPYLQTKRMTTASFHLNTSLFIHNTSSLNADSTGGIPALVQIRHRMKPVSAIVRPRTAPRLPPDPAATSRGVENGIENGIECTFDEPVVGVAPGQVAAVYFGSRCMGSGVIDETWCQEEIE